MIVLYLKISLFIDGYFVFVMFIIYLFVCLRIVIIRLELEQETKIDWFYNSIQ